MINEADMNIDYEKLRKKLAQKDFWAGMLSVGWGNVENCVEVYEATPEQLIAIARRRNINLDKYKIK